MGCDIHAHIEYYSEGNSFASSFSGELVFNRDYVLFGLLAGVRSMSPAIFPPRGIPTSPKISYQSELQYYTTVLEDQTYNNINKRGVVSKNTISRTEAERAIKVFGSASYSDDTRTKLIHGYHTPSWLELNELRIVRKHYLLENIEFYSELSGKKRKHLLDFIHNKDEKELMKYVFVPYENSVLYSAINTMDSLEKCGESVTSRLVFWFDS